MRPTNTLKTAFKTVFSLVGFGLLTISFQNCSGGFSASGGQVISSNSLSSNGVSQVQMALKVVDSAGNVIYDDSVANSSLVLKDGQDYKLIVSSASTPPAGTTLVLNYTDLGVIGAAAKSISLQFGTNTIKSGTIGIGTYKLEFDAAAPSMVPASKTYNASMTCASPTFTAASLNVNGVSVSGTTNMYNISAAGVVAGANGVGPYMCAIDQTGASILDSKFQDCSTAFANSWSNYVGARTVHVAVRDSCQIVQQVAANVTLPFTVPAVGSEVPFVSGVTSAGTGIAATDARVKNLSYLATNQSPNIDVQSTTNGSTFTIQASHNYMLASSVDFGIKIQLSGLVNTVNMATASGTIDASNARISSLAYSTDESGDTQVALSFTSSSCVLSNQHAKVIMVSGVPCTTAGAGDQNSATIEVWGHYKCTSVASSAGSFTIEGDFDGLDHEADSCVGAPGGAGGGIVPINF